jgi:hypothetical protein
VRWACTIKGNLVEIGWANNEISDVEKSGS